MSKWVLNRLGLVNFWYYREQVFELSDGHLLLRGHNGSGKSVTMQSLIPVLLDGDTSASRLDSFGSRARRMEDLLLGEPEVGHKDDAVGYLWAEYKKDQHYITTGIGIHARRGGDHLRKWFFAIEDGRRIGHDFSLTTADTGKVATPLAKRTLKQAMAKGGHFFEHASEYADYVRTHIFGFESADDFSDTIKLMINVRSPKLNGDLKPARLEAILSESLPSLTIDNVAASAQTLKQMDAIQQNIETNRNQLAELTPLVRAYEKYQTAFLTGLVAKVKQAKQAAATAAQNVTALNAAMAATTEQKQSLEERLTAIQGEQAQAQKQYDSLAHAEGFDLAAKGAQLKQELDQLTKRQQKQQSKRAQIGRDLAAAQTALTDTEEKLIKRRQALAEQQQQAVTLAEQAGFAVQHQLIFDAAAPESPLTRRLIDQQVGPYRDQLQAVLDLFDLLRQLNRSIEKLDTQLSDLNQQLDQLDRDLTNWQLQFDQELDQLKQQLVALRPGWQAEVVPTVVGQVQANIEQLYQPAMLYWADALRPLHDAFEVAKGTIISKEHAIQAQIDAADRQIKDWQAKQRAIQQAPYPVPERRASVAKLRQQAQLGVPFYTLVDFIETVPSTIRNAVEGALMASGVLDALVVPAGQLVWGDQQLAARPALFAPATLADYLKPDIDAQAPVTPAQLLAILQTIQVGEASEVTDAAVARVSRAGEFVMGVVTGHGAEQYEAQFIGASAQERTRKHQLAELQQQIDAMLVSRGRWLDQLAVFDQQLVQIDADWQALPNDDDLKALNETLDKVRQDIRRHQRHQQQVTKQLTAERTARDKQAVEQQQLMRQSRLAQTEEAYQTARKALEDYRVNMIEQVGLLDGLKQQEDLVAGAQASVAQNQQRLTEGTEQLAGIDLQVSQKQGEVQANMTAQAAAGDLNQLRTSLEAARKQVATLNQEQIEKEKRVNQLTGDLRVQASKLVPAKEAANFAQRFADLLSETEQAALEPLANPDEVRKQLLQQPIPTSEVLNDLADKAGKQYNLRSGILLDFRPSQSHKPLIEVPDWVLQTEDDPALDDWQHRLNNRMVMEVMVDNAQRPLQDLVKLLKAQVESDAQALSVQEEQLFKAIIFESLGNVIRQKIRSAEKWVVDMNQVLKQQENSSQLKLKIKWEVKTRDDISDKEIHQVVGLFKKDARLLTPADTKTLQTFLMAQIHDTQSDYTDKHQQPQMPTILQEALDYRNWFAFELETLRPNRQPKRLTDREFNQFSGGEKAITMYTPLFVAMYSRYKNAGEDAPAIITLDEAFAGIDDRNIAELFRTIGRLDFNYVMNSQVLQGEYDTVPILNTYELLRAENSDLVTAIKTHWNGKQVAVQEASDGTDE